jgi:hypothetical protein
MTETSLVSRYSQWRPGARPTRADLKPLLEAAGEGDGIELLVDARVISAQKSAGD